MPNRDVPKEVVICRLVLEGRWQGETGSDGRSVLGCRVVGGSKIAFCSIHTGFAHGDQRLKATRIDSLIEATRPLCDEKQRA